MPHCQIRLELRSKAAGILENIISLTKEQIRALAANDQRRIVVLDKELEKAFGKKERAFGSLKQHQEEHGC
jgi:hypothetical protein